MSRQVFKSISNDPIEFIPSSSKEDQTLTKDAKEIKDRPLIFMVKKFTREDRYNIRGLLELESRVNGAETETVALNIGSVSQYIWENCVVEAKNVLLDDGAYESLKGKAKDDLFNTTGIDVEIMDCVNFIQTQSSLTEAEAKN